MVAPDRSKLIEYFFTRFLQDKKIGAGDSSGELLFHFGALWESWLAYSLLPAEVDQLRQAVKEIPEEGQREFIRWLEQALSSRSARSGEARLMMRQVASLAEFDSWSPLETFKFGIRGEGVNAVFLQLKKGSLPTDVIPLTVVLLPLKEKDPKCQPIGWSPGKDDLEQVLTACRNLLHRPGWLWIPFCWLVAWKPRSRWLYSPLIITLLLTLFLLLPVSSEVEHLVPFALWAIVLMTAYMISSAIYSVIKEARIVRQWRELLDRSLVCVAAGDLKSPNNIFIDGDSFCLSFSVALFKALYEEAPLAARESWFWGRSLEKFVAEAGSWSFTGGMNKSGFITEVEREKDKITASEANPEITRMILPAQKVRQPVSSEKKSEYAETQPGNTQVREQVLKRFTRALLSFAFLPDRSFPSCRLKLFRAWHLSQVVVWLADGISWQSVAANTMTLLLGATLLLSYADVRSIILPPADPQFIYHKCGFRNGPNGNELTLGFYTGDPSYFAVGLQSGYWANRSGIGLKPHERLNGEGVAEIGLFMLDRRRSENYRDGEVELTRPRQFLWREFTPAIIERDRLDHIVVR